MEILKVFVIVLYLLLCKYILGFECNMNDDMLLVLKKNGGVI